jgi:hypothetical protein
MSERIDPEKDYSHASNVLYGFVFTEEDLSEAQAAIDAGSPFLCGLTPLYVAFILSMGQKPLSRRHNT